MWKNNMETVQVDDIFVMSYLISKGYKFTDKFMRGRRVILTFEGDRLSQEIADYFAGGDVSAIKFSEAYREIKDIVKDVLDENQQNDRRK
jgi:hypothetical protein